MRTPLLSILGLAYEVGVSQRYASFNLPVSRILFSWFAHTYHISAQRAVQPSLQPRSVLISSSFGLAQPHLVVVRLRYWLRMTDAGGLRLQIYFTVLGRPVTPALGWISVERIHVELDVDGGGHCGVRIRQSKSGLG